MRRFSALHFAPVKRPANASPISMFRPFLDAVPETGMIRGLEAINVTSSISMLTDHIKTHKLAMVMGSPSCGKTSLANLMKKALGTKVHKLEVVSSSLSLPEFLMDGVPHTLTTVKAAMNSTDIYTVDEAHKAFNDSAFCDHFIKNTPFHMAFFSTSSSTEFGTTPQELEDNKFWMFAPSLDREVS